MNNEANELLEKHFDLAFAAPNGVQKLRELILTFAMQGKLVPQDPNDQPASELLKTIEAEKQRLAKEGKIKQPKPLPDIKLVEVPYDLPKEWKWVRLGCLIDLVSGQHLTPSEYNEIGIGFSYYTGPADFGEKSPNATRWTVIDRAIAIEGDILLTVKGAGVGKTNVLIEEKAAISRQLMALRVICIDRDFLLIFLKTIFNELQALAIGIAIPGIGREDVLLRKFPLPPLAEQHRIVAKIDRLMAQCDELENLGGDRNQKRITVHTAAINRLLAAQENSAFSTAWDFIQQHFGDLYSVKENVAELRKAILQLAVMGKLVPQASVVQVASLESILAEASANGVAKGPTSDTTATEILRISAGTSQRDFYVNEDDFKHVALSTSEIQKYQLLPGDLLACRFNGNLHYVGRFSYYRGASKRIQVNPDKLIRFRIDTKFHCPRYVCYTMNAAQTRETIEAMCATTAGNIGLSAGRLKTVKIPLPSLAEQRRIVAKIDQLMTLCDRLEQQIDAATDKRTELLNALMAQV
jgi:type I restriction enzyme, S subunit